MRFIIIFGVCLTLFACASTGPAERVEKEKLLKGYSFTETNFNAQSNGYYLMVKKMGDTWQLLAKGAKSDNVLKEIRKAGGGELFWIEPTTKQITYYYYNSKRDDFYPLRSDLELECVHGRNAYKFHPACLRPFIKRTGMGAIQTMMTFGMDSTKVFDEVAAFNALTSADVFAQLDQLDKLCTQTRKNAQAYLDNHIELTPVIVDKSGFYKNEVIYTKQKTFTLAADCTLDKTAFEVGVKITDDSYEYAGAVMIRREFLYRNRLKTIRPEFVIRGKYTSKGFINPVTGSDKYLTAKVKKVKPYEIGDVIVDVELINNSNHYVTVNKLSFYTANRITTETLSPQKTLPPQAIEKHRMRIKNLDIKYKLLMSLTKSEAKKKKILIGLSVLYTANNQDHSLLAKKHIPYIQAY